MRHTTLKIPHYFLDGFPLLIGLLMLAGGLSGCVRTRDTGGEAPESPHSVGNQGSAARGTPPSPSRNAMPYPLDTLREEFDARVRWNETVSGRERTEANKRTTAKGAGGYSIRETFVATLEETGREDTPAGEVSKEILNSKRKDTWIDALVHYSTELKLAGAKIQYVASKGRVPKYDGSDSKVISDIESAAVRDLIYTRVPALVGGQMDENWLNDRAMEFENVSRRLNAYAAAAEVDTLSITKDGVELRGAKALQAATDSLFQAIKNGADHTTAAIASLADPDFNRDTVRIENEAIATGKIKRQEPARTTTSN
jgi:hypothetical protein